MNRWEVFRGEDGQWYWHLRADNEEIVAVSEGYSSKEHAIEGVRNAKADAADASEIVTDD